MTERDLLLLDRALKQGQWARANWKKISPEGQREIEQVMKIVQKGDK